MIEIIVVGMQPIKRNNRLSRNVFARIPRSGDFLKYIVKVKRALNV